ncbi:MAG: DUF3093 domain-containing protein [Micropruina sp.]|uniref:DUF3093 domain-containing protein n=1 Tax=Micropruina sp. TaxID=2737536 RepID=UPI0039E28EDA
MTSSDSASGYSERLRVPAAYWGIGLFFGLTFVTAVSFMLGDLILVLSTVAVIGLVAWTLLAWGALRIVVDAEGIRVGRSLLEWRYVGTAVIADRALRGRVLAREDAFLALRPYTNGLVLIGVADEADPHLCWLVSTRHPQELLRAIEDNRPSGVAETTERSLLDSGE